jgi:hypothetical protein
MEPETHPDLLPQNGEISPATTATLTDNPPAHPPDTIPDAADTNADPNAIPDWVWAKIPENLPPELRANQAAYVWRVERLIAKLAADPELELRAIAEIYVMLAEFREITVTAQLSGGMGGLIGKLLKGRL